MGSEDNVFTVMTVGTDHARTTPGEVAHNAHSECCASAGKTSRFKLKTIACGLLLAVFAINRITAKRIVGLRFFCSMLGYVRSSTEE